MFVSLHHRVNSEEDPPVGIYYCVISRSEISYCKESMLECIIIIKVEYYPFHLDCYA